jgi:hypothetical protein
MSGAAAATAAPDAAARCCSGRRTRKHLVQVPLAEDQHPVGDLGSDGQHEAFGVVVRHRALPRNLECFDARVRKDRIERRRGLPGPIADQEPETGGTSAEIHQQVAGLLRGPRSVGMPGHAQDV